MKKPLDRGIYSSIPHLPGSRYGDGDKWCPTHEADFFIKQTETPLDHIIVTEKLDGSCVGVLKKDGILIPLIRAGYPAIASKRAQHRIFALWAEKYAEQFNSLLNEGEYVVGEWLLQAHGTRYDLKGRQPFAIFDIFDPSWKGARVPYTEMLARVEEARLTAVPVLYRGFEAVSINDALLALKEHGHYGAVDPAEGMVWRRERKMVCLGLAKYVRAGKEPGIYLEGETGKDPIWNISPKEVLK